MSNLEIARLVLDHSAILTIHIVDTIHTIQIPIKAVTIAIMVSTTTTIATVVTTATTTIIITIMEVINTTGIIVLFAQQHGRTNQTAIGVVVGSPIRVVSVVAPVTICTTPLLCRMIKALH